MKIKVTQSLPDGQVIQQVLLQEGATPLKIQAQPGAKISFSVESLKTNEIATNAEKTGTVKKVGNHLVLELEGVELLEVTEFYANAGASVGNVEWNYLASEAVSLAATPEALAAAGAAEAAVLLPSTSPAWAIFAGGAAFAAGNSSDAAGSGGGLPPSPPVDSVAPTLVITSNMTELVTGQTATITFTFSEVVRNFTSSSIVATHGTLSGLATLDGQVYTATFSPTAGLSAAIGRIAVAGNTYQDLSGNPGAVQVDSSILVNTFITNTATITRAVDNLASGTTVSDLAPGASTNDVTLDLSGGITTALGANEQVVVYTLFESAWTRLGVATATTGASSWSFATPTLARGDIQFAVRVEDAGLSAKGPFSSAWSQKIQSVSISTMNDNVGSVQGQVASGGASDDLRPTLTGLLGAPLAAGEEVAVYASIGGAAAIKLGVATTAGNTWSYTPSPDLATGSYGLTSVVQAAGHSNMANALAVSSTYNLVFENPSATLTAAAATLVMTDDSTGVSHYQVNSSGALASGTSTEDTTPVISGTYTGTLGANEKIRIYNNDAYLGDATPNTSTNTWSYTPTVAMRASGLNTFSAKVVNTVNNLSGNAVSDSVIINSFTASYDPTALAIKGIVGSLFDPAKERLALYKGSTFVSAITVAPDQTWSASLSGYNGTVDTYRVALEDLSGTTAKMARNLVVAVGTATAEVTTMTVTDDSSSIGSFVSNATGSVASGTSTDDTVLSLSGAYTGTLTSDQVIRVSDNGTFLANATVNTGANTWSYTTTALARGNHVLTAQVYTTPTASSTTGVSSTALVQSMGSFNGFSDDGSLVQTVPISKTGRYVMVARQGNNNWFLFNEVQVMSGGVNVALGKTATAYAANADNPGKAVDGNATTFYSSGNNGTPSVMQWWQVDLGADVAIDSISFSPYASNINTNINSSIFVSSASVGSLSGKGSIAAVMATPGAIFYGTSTTTAVTTFAITGVSTADSTPTLTGKLATGLLGDEVLAFYDGATYLGLATVATDGNWTYVHAGAPFAPGAYTLTARLQDVARSVTKLAQNYEWQVISPAAPTASVSTLVVTDDANSTAAIGLSTNATGAVASGSSTDDATPKFSGTYSGTLLTGEQIQVFDNGVLLGNATTVDTVNRTWTYDVPTANALGTGSHVFTAKVVNPLTTASQTVAVPSSTVLIQTLGSFGVVADNATLVQSAPIPRTARYVMVARQGGVGAWLMFNEVQVMSGGVNVAQGKTATAYASNTDTPSKAVDGSSSSFYASGNAGSASSMQWWQVDLGADFAIDSVIFTPYAANTTTYQNANIFLSSASVGSLSGKASVAAAKDTLGVVTFGPTSASTADTTYSDTVITTADATPILTGKLATGLLAGERLAVYSSTDVYLGNATVDTDGTWSFAVSSPLTAGIHQLRIKLQDSAGASTRIEAPFEVSILSADVPTTAVTSLVVTDDASTTTGIGLSTNTTGTVASGASMDDATPKFSGTYSGTLLAGERIQVFDNGLLLGNATSVDTVNRTWTFDVASANALSTGSHVFTAKVVNPAANSSQTVAVPSSTALVQTLGSFGVVADNATLVQSALVPRTARYVMVARQGGVGAWLMFNEVQVMSGGVNVAQGKTATAYAVSGAFTAGQAVDGSSSTNYSSGNNGTASSMQWWQVDLGADFAIDSVSLMPNTTTGTSSNLNIFLSPASAGSLSGKANVAAAKDTLGVVTFGPTGDGTAVTTFVDTVFTTTDTTPSLTGKLATGLLAGERLAVYSSTDVYLGDATVGADGTWTYLVTSPLLTGLHKLRIKLQNSAGTNTRIEAAFEVGVLSADAPTAAVTSLVVTDDSSATAGNAYSINLASFVAQGTSTDDTTPTLNGTLSKPLGWGEAVKIYDGQSLLGEAIVQDTLWTFTPTTPLTMGSHTFTARVENPNTQLSSPFLGIPVTVQISSLGWNTLVVDAGDIQGNLLANGNSATSVATTDSSLELAGILGASIDPAKERVAIYDGGVLLGYATLSGSAWRYSASDFVPGMHALEVRLENIATGVASLSRAQNVQIVSPAGTPTTFVASISVTDDTSANTTGTLYRAGNSSGAVASQTSTDDSTPLISGGLSAALANGEVVQIFDGSTYLGAATTSGATWSYAPTASNALAVGSHAISARVINTSSGLASASINSTVLVQALTDFTIAPQGSSAKGAQFVRYIMVHQGAVSSPEVFDVGYIRILGPNSTVLSDLPGITWTTSDPSKVPVSINGSSNPQFAVTYNPRFPETGYTTAAATSEGWIQVDLGAAYEVSSITLGKPDPGTWTYVSNQSMAANPSLSALQSGTNGAIFVGQMSPLMGGTGVNTVAFNVPQSVFTAETTATVSGKLGVALSATGNERVGVYLNEVYLGEASVNGTNWSYDLSNVPRGNHLVKVTVEDKLTGSVRLAQSQILRVAETTAPDTLVSITSATDNEGAQTGVLVSGNSTDDTTLKLDGTLSAMLKSGEVVQIFDGSTLLGTATALGRDWSYTTPALTYQSHNLTAKVVNTVTGLSGATSNAITALVQNPDITLSVDTGTLTQTPQSVRYVMVARNMPSDLALLSMSEVEVMSGGVNVALGKPTAGQGWTAAMQGNLSTSAAVDGSTFWGSAYLYNDGFVNGLRYWQVDLGDFYPIDSIKFTGNPLFGTLAQAKVYFSGTSMSGFQSELALAAAPGVTVAATLSGDLVQTVNTSGLKSGANYASDTTPTLSGTLGTNLGATERLAVYDGNIYLGNATITNTATGAWTFTVPAGKALAAGAHTMMVRVESLDGSVIKATATEWLSIPGAAPTANVLTAFDSGSAGVSMLQVTGNLTTALAAGQKLGVYDGDVLLGFATSTSTLWTFSQAGLGLGSHAITAKVTNEVGQVGAAGSSQSVTIVGTQPTQLVTVSGAVETSGAFAYGAQLLPGQSVADPLKSLVTKDTTPGVWGTLSANLGSGETLVAYDGTQALAGTMVVNGRSWNFVPTTALSEGYHSLSFRVESGANTGASSARFGLEVDAVVDNFATVTTLSDNQGALTGNLAAGGSTEDPFLVLSCKLEFAQQGVVKVFDGANLIAEQYSIFAADQFLKINVPQLGAGSHTLSVKFYNTLGVEQTSAASTQVVNVVVGEGGQIASMTTSSAGVDTLSLSNYGQAMDFTKLGASTIDKVDLGSYGGNSVKLSTADVLDAGINLFNAGSGWSFSNAADVTRASTSHQMVLDGSGSVARGSSTVTISESAAAINTLSPWALTGTATHGGESYNVYSNVVSDNAQLLINQNLVVSHALI